MTSVAPRLIRSVKTGRCDQRPGERISGADEAQDRRYVVYGETDMRRALERIEEHRRAEGLLCVTSAMLATLGGVYCEDCNIAAFNESEKGRNGVATWEVDVEYAERLWRLSELWTSMMVS